MRQRNGRLALALVSLPYMALGQKLIDFENLAEGLPIDNQLSGLSFSNAVIIQSVVSLNEGEYPPRSGVKVISDIGGPISIILAKPVETFQGYFTHEATVSLRAFDISGSVIDETTANIDNRTGSGRAPNEFLYVSSSRGISRIVIQGAPEGSSFTLDDIGLVPLGSPLPGLTVSPAHLRVQQTTISLLPPISKRSVDAITVNPPAVAKAASTVVTITAAVTGTFLIPDGIKLQRRDTSGIFRGILGTMNDDGLAGDAVAGDKVFSIRVTLNETTLEPVTLRVSARFRGSPVRIVSPLIFIPVV
jgi:hypothetical protein